MVLSMFNRIPFRFTCPKCKRLEEIVISRLDNVTEWPCEYCEERTDLTKEPYASEIERLRRTASESDKWTRQRGETVERRD